MNLKIVENKFNRCVRCHKKREHYPSTVEPVRSMMYVTLRMRIYAQRDECPLSAQSGHTDAACQMSAFGGKADLRFASILPGWTNQSVQKVAQLFCTEWLL